MPSSPRRARRRGTPKASLCEGGVTAFGRDGGRDVIRIFSPPVGFADSPLPEGGKKTASARKKYDVKRAALPGGSQAVEKAFGFSTA